MHLVYIAGGFLTLGLVFSSAHARSISEVKRGFWRNTFTDVINKVTDQVEKWVKTVTEATSSFFRNHNREIKQKLEDLPTRGWFNKFFGSNGDQKYSEWKSLYNSEDMTNNFNRYGEVYHARHPAVKPKIKVYRLMSVSAQTNAVKDVQAQTKLYY